MEPITLILLYIFAALLIAVMPSLFVRPCVARAAGPYCPRCGRGWGMV
jgi:hypothetical protein